MTRLYRDIVQHSLTYGAGQVLGRLASVLLLPFYTSHLRPADYGTVAVIDLAGSLLMIMTGSGIASAAARLQFDRKDFDHRRNVWWTGLIVVVCVSSLIIVSGLAGRGQLAQLLVGPAVPHAATFVTLMLANVWCGTIEQFVYVFLRLQKTSALFVALSLARLLLNITLNIYLIGFERLGVLGLLLGNLLTAVAACVAALIVLRSLLGPFSFQRQLTRELWMFAWPLVITGLLSVVMHYADRYLLRAFVGLDQVGVYALGYQVGQGVNALVLMPFAAIWGVLVYEIADQPSSRRVYARVFESFVFGLGVVLLGVSLFADRLVALLAASDYHAAESLIPVICLAYLFFSLHDQFRVPALLAKRTEALLPVYALAATLNVSTNLLLIPAFGAQGAAWASVITFAAFSLFGLLRYRRIEQIPYRFARVSALVVGMVATYAGVWVSRAMGYGATLTDVLAAACWLTWLGAFAAFVTRGSTGRHVMRRLRSELAG